MRPAENPFRASRISSLEYRFRGGVDWPVLWDRLQQLGNRAALVGAEGAGKTTLLEQMAEPLCEKGFHARLLTAASGRAGEALGRAACNDEFLLVDSAERFSRVEWLRFRWLTRRAAGLVITAHGTGLLPTLLECKTTVELFEELVCELLKDQSRNPVPLEAGDLEAVFWKHAGNLRASLRELYDRFAPLPCMKEAAVCNVQSLSGF